MAWSGKSRHARGYDTAWDKLRKVILTRDKHLCQACKRKCWVQVGTHVDHIEPKSKGGADDSGNLECVCVACHAEKTAREGAEAQGRTYRPKLVIGIDGWPTV